MIIDTHAHLDQIENIDQVLKDAKAAGVEGIMAVGVDLASNKKNLELKSRVRSPKIFIGLGIHPGNINSNEIQETLDFIGANIPEANAVGEIGLDFWYRWVRKDDTKKAEQRHVFVRQLELAKEAGLPVIVHSRGAWQECYETLESLGIKQAVFHWYSGPLEVLKKILSQGYYISATPSLAYSPESRQAAEYAPIEQLLIETDSPVFYKGVGEEQGFQAGPKDVLRTLNLYCDFKKIDREKALEILNNNARRIFKMTVSREA